MRKYEYTSYQSSPLFVEGMNEMDSQGWEVITILLTSPHNITVYLRRPVQETNDGFVELPG